MPNLGAVLKNEITRLARKEVRVQVDSIKKANSSCRRDIAELKRQVVLLERKLNAIGKATPVTAGNEKPATVRFASKGLHSLRSRLALSAAEFGALAGASAQSVYHWETGKTVPRKAQQAVLVELRGLGKREARAKLDALSTPPRHGRNK